MSTPAAGADASGPGSASGSGSGPTQPDGPHAVEAPDGDGDRRDPGDPALRERADQVLRGIPLGARMVAIVCAVLLVALTATGVTALALLQRNLVEQVDVQLSDYAPRLIQAANRRGGFGDPTELLPSDYYIELRAADGTVIDVLATADTTGAGTPRLPLWTADQVAAAADGGFTVRSQTGSARWRAVMLPGSARGQYATVAIALPLTSVDRTVDKMRLALVMTGLGVIALGSVAGWVAVRRSLRPLQEMESTAQAIAAGDLTRRVPARPESTEVGRLGGALNVMLGHIERAFAERAASEGRMRRFVADASHELRTPLATIRGYSELYRMGALTSPEQVDDTVRRIEESATRMGRLVEDLLALARLDEGRPLRTEPVDLTVVAADALSDLSALDRTRPVRITAVPEDAELGPCVVVGDEDRLRQVLGNLTGNVVQHTPPGTAVEIAVGRDSAGWAVLEVRDHGPGIAPEHAPRVFERFYRVDASRTRESGGAGLGMAIVAAIVEAHHGRVKLAPTPGGGTTVRVWLPRTDVGGDDADVATTTPGDPDQAGVHPAHPSAGLGAAGAVSDAGWGRPARGADASTSPSAPVGAHPSEREDARVEPNG